MSKNFPSKEYKENIGLYKKMHREGYDLIDRSRKNT
tara:strand:- start:373 stop:480 length:108 start_codon:yes stop_codon:yes gene_type:complete